MTKPRRDPWVRLTDQHRAEILLILPCNAAGCVGNYFRAEVYRASGWNTWRMDAVRALEKAGFRIVRQGKHTVMTDGVRILTIPRHNPVNAFTMACVGG